MNLPSQTSFIVPASTNKRGRAGTERHLTIITTGVFSSSLLGYGKAPKARSAASRYIMCRVPLATCHSCVPNISTKPRFYHLTEHIWHFVWVVLTYNHYTSNTGIRDYYRLATSTKGNRTDRGSESQRGDLGVKDNPHSGMHKPRQVKSDVKVNFEILYRTNSWSWSWTPNLTSWASGKHHHLIWFRGSVL